LVLPQNNQTMASARKHRRLSDSEDDEDAILATIGAEPEDCRFSQVTTLSDHLKPLTHYELQRVDKANKIIEHWDCGFRVSEWPVWMQRTIAQDHLLHPQRFSVVLFMFQNGYAPQYILSLINYMEATGKGYDRNATDSIYYLLKKLINGTEPKVHQVYDMTVGDIGAKKVDLMRGIAKSYEWRHHEFKLDKRTCEITNMIPSEWQSVIYKKK
jgi:hypothetical protein